MIVTFGDSITDGTRSTERWQPSLADVLAERLHGGNGGYSIVNASASRQPRSVPRQCHSAARPALCRLDRDVFTFANVTHMTVLEGINDIGMGRPNPPNADQIVAATSRSSPRGACAWDKGDRRHAAAL